MTQEKIVALLTDFGLEDIYVGVLKGAIAKINPRIRVIDITHNIPPQNITAASFALVSSYQYFPENTVYVVVVDPAVGSDRRSLAIEFSGGFLVGPDNGLFTEILKLTPAIKAVELTNSQYWLTSHPSNTFHGRDIFAPVGAYLANGIALTALGKEISPESLFTQSSLPLEITDNSITGSIQYIDRFGNGITNIPANLLKGKKYSVITLNHEIALTMTYSQVPVGKPLVLVSSNGYLEIAINGGSAKKQLKLKVGSLVTCNLN